MGTTELPSIFCFGSRLHNQGDHTDSDSWNHLAGTLSVPLPRTGPMLQSTTVFRSADGWKLEQPRWQL